MSQKSILSFFKTSGTSAKETKKCVVVNESPVKKVRNKRKVQCLESDDESSDLKSKDLNEDLNKNSEGFENGVTASKDPTSTNEHGEKNGIKENGTHSTEKPSKLKKIDNEVENNPEHHEKNSETSNSAEPSTSDASRNSSSKTASTSSAVNQNDIVDYVPKRKTARKQMSSSKCRKENITVVKDELESKICENEIVNNPGKVNGSASSPAKASDEMSETTLSEDMKIDSENKKSPKDTKKCSDDIGKDSENKKSPKVRKKSTDNMEIDSKNKKSPNDRKKSTNDSKDSKNKKSQKVTKKSSDDMEIDSKNKESPKHTKKSFEDTKNDSKNKKSLKDVKKSVGLKSKANASTNDKGSLMDKSTKKESIHSFFTPVKKNEDKNNKEETKKCHEEIEDSPVKATKKIKKTQCLESDDENENVESESVVLPESNTINNFTSSGEKEDSITNTENSAEEAAKESSKKTDAETSKSNCEKPKLSVKSTSVVSNVYDPSKNHYHPIEDACWKHGEKVPYLALAKTLELIENTPGRLKTIEILSNFLRSVIVLSPDDILQSVYLCLNRLAPEYCGIELGVGETLLMKAVAQATGRTVDKIKAEVAVKGDLGLVSESSRGNQRVMFAPPKLTVSSVFQKFLEIAKMSGNASMAKKTDKIKGLFVACRDCEAKYIIRSLSGKLRIGLAEQSVLCGIARAAVLTPPSQTYPPEKIDASKGMSADKFKELLDSQTLILKTAYCESPNYDLIIPVLLKEGISALPERCQLTPGIPLKPMLAHPTAGIDKVLERFDKNAFTCEFKYDGERAQIHKTEKGDVKIFSRNQEDNTSKYPDIISRLPKALKETTKSFVLDSEAVAWDKETKQILPFQVLSTRKRKDAVESEITVQVCIMAFDLLYLNGESLVKKSLKDRRSLLHSSFNGVENEFMFAQYKDGNSAETMQEFLDESVKGNCEGLMVKSLEIDASYEIAKRSHNWLKLKKDYLQGIGDTLDLVVIGGYYGKGKRTGNYGGFLLACYDEDNEEFQSICKLGTGFKDDNLETHTKFLKQHIIKEPKSYFRCDRSLEPDVWFEPVQVWEIKCADLSISPVHKAAIGIVDAEKGISLRFPRFIRIRDDKTPENATNSVQIAEMYQKQQQIQNTANKNAKIEEDYY